MPRALTLRQVKALGVRVAMDDFGTGYSRSQPSRLPFDKIKIVLLIKAVDTNGQVAAIVRAVLGRRGLGLPVLARCRDARRTEIPGRRSL